MADEQHRTEGRPRVRRVDELFVYRHAFAQAMRLFEASQGWPREERYALTDQVRRSSRAVCANLAEAWAKRRYPRHFRSKISDAHAEAEETLVWVQFAARCHYLDAPTYAALTAAYRQINAGLVRMAHHVQDWTTA